MQLVPVIDLKQGRVVRGIGGQRAEYRPIVSSLVDSSEPGAVARALVSHFAPTEIYVADLDAIETGEPDFAAWRAISGAGLRLWIDAGVGTSYLIRFFRETLRRGRISGSPVIGLESTDSIDSLAELHKAAGTGAIFSLDMREGVPLSRDTADHSLSPLVWATAAVKAGFERIIVLDLADVGTGRGSSTLALCRTLKAEFPRIQIVAGGGVRHAGDLRDLAAAGCSAALVASALHDGRISPDDWNELLDA